MATFAFSGRTRTGESVSGERVGDTMDAVVTALRREQILVTRIQPAKAKVETKAKAEVGAKAEAKAAADPALAGALEEVGPVASVPGSGAASDAAYGLD